MVDVNPVHHLRRRLGGQVRGLLAARPLPAEWFDRAPDDPGLVAAGSVAWRVHADRAALVGGLRALLYQTLHPLAMAGVADHSDYRHDPWGRLHRTGAFIAATTYGTTEAAEAAVERVRRVHRRVVGVAPNGLPYRADDPELLLWVHATEVDSFLRAYQRYGDHGRLTPEEADAYVADLAPVGERLGVVDPPRTTGELAGYLRRVRPALRAGGQAHEAVRFLLLPPLPLYLRPAYGVLSAAAVGLLPRYAQMELRLPTPPLVDPLVVRPATRAALEALGRALGPPPGRSRGTAPDSVPESAPARAATA